MNQEAMEKKEGGLFSDLGVTGKDDTGDVDKGNFLTGLTLMIPVKPMLAKYAICSFLLSYFVRRACRSMDEVISRCPNGMYTEIKYDGERIQIHKKGIINYILDFRANYDRKRL